MSAASETTEKPRVQVYGSSVAGNIFVKKNQEWVQTVLTIHKIPFEFVDVAADEDALKYMKRRNRGAVGLPQLFTDGEFKGLFKEFEEAVEARELKKFLDLED
ncbi:1180_t:CDS:2 [Paraglomus occultum]|uniref:1180_t:CDS:1 n=1 Tax=Paraglomus occultum TaxID=144539 RepID=A0A9N9AWJ3_9GLOM|nr:1180_t:CDS:2 [Paraglomus occultum]